MGMRTVTVEVRDEDTSRPKGKDLNTHEPTQEECAQVVRYFRDDYDEMPEAAKRGWREDAVRFLECWQKLKSKHSEIR